MDLSPTTSIWDLPDELLIRILTYVKFDSTGLRNLTQCLVVCRRWSSVGIPLLHKDFIWRFGQDTWPLTIGVNAANFQHILSFTLLIFSDHSPLVLNPPMSSSMPTVDWVWNTLASKYDQNHFDQLCLALGSMSKLQTFSLCIRGTTAMPNCWFPRAQIDQILRALPHTIKHLEVNTMVDRDRPHEETHLCDTLRSIIPRLSNLRLRLSSLCPSLFTLPDDSDTALDGKPRFITANHMTRALIDTYMTHFGDTRLCGASTDLQRGYIANGSLPPAWWIPPAYRKLIAGLRDAYDAGAFPTTECLTLFRTLGWHNIHSAPLLDHSTSVYHDIKSGKTTTIPSIRVRYNNRNHAVVRTLTGEYHINDVPTFVELQGGAWLLTRDRFGSRFPASMAKAKRDDGYAFSSVYVDIPADARPVPVRGERDNVWEREAIVGKTLLRAEVHEGLWGDFKAREQLPEGWEVDTEEEFFIRRVGDERGGMRGTNEDNTYLTSEGEELAGS